MVVGDALAFGVAADESSLVTQKVSIVRKSDKKEARDKSGVVVAVSYYNHTNEISIEGLGTSATTVGAALSLAGTFTLVGDSFVDEVTIEQGNEDFAKCSIKGTAYSGISA